MQRLVGLLVAGAILLALVARPPNRDDLWRLPVLPALALAAWALVDPVVLGVPVAGGGGLVLLLGAVVGTLAVSRRLGSGQDVTVRVTADPSGKAFVKDKAAVVEAEIFGCRPNICGSETDSETVRIQR